MKRREFIKSDLNPPYTRLCKEVIKPTTKLFGDDLSKHLKEVSEAKRAGQQMQKTVFSAKVMKNRGYRYKPYDKRQPVLARLGNLETTGVFFRTQSGDQPNNDGAEKAEQPQQQIPVTQEAVYSHLRGLGDTCMGHIDDSLLLGYDHEACKNNIVDSAKLFQQLQFVKHPEKSVLHPAQAIEFLGFEMNSLPMTVEAYT
ncbi:Hypothetical predicted protein [Paramuricea clavata]|uniref:Uncharacterized protein n=1 Tax=Paramuricea clavata TaxID=317549 RepID=A0A7D9EU03_PARCT|nr:Hypothetical predicted protein [Paramuricea clavata]